MARPYLVANQSCMDKARAHGSSSASQLIEPNLIQKLCKKPDLLKCLEAKFRRLKAKFLPMLVPRLGAREARLELSVWTLVD